MSELVLRLGTRRSPLALAQSRQVAAALEASARDLAVELVPIETRGDRLAGDLGKLGGKGLFTAEIERGLSDGSLDLAVHSLKDLPVGLPPGLRIAAHPRRADPRDALISDLASRPEELPSGAVVLTGSSRRRAQLLHLRADLDVRPLRGNVGTRLARWRESGHAALVLAVAGLSRLGIDDAPIHPLEPECLLPAPGQGILAVEVKAGSRAEPYCRALDHPASARAAEAERRVVAAFGGDCDLPLAAWARDHGTGMLLSALLATPDGRRVCRGEAEGDDPATAAEACVDALRRDGAERVIAAIRA